MKVSKHWESYKTISTIYAGGEVYANKAGTLGWSLFEGKVVNFSLADGKVLSEEGQDVKCFTVNSKEQVITYSEDNMLREQAGSEWKSDSVVRVMKVDPKDALLATGGSDNSVRVYQLGHAYLTHSFKQHKGPVLALAFHPSELLLVSASSDYTVKVFDLLKYSCVKTLSFENSVRHLGFLNKSLITCMNNQTCRWSLKTWKLKQSYKAENEITSMQCSKRVVVGDSGGFIYLLSPKNLEAKKHRQVSSFPIVSLSTLENGEIIATNEEFYVFCIGKKLNVSYEFIGHVDEVTDIKWMNDTNLLVALNSYEAKLVDTETSKVSSLRGHSDNILCVDVFEDYIATGSKDQSVKYWKLTEMVGTYYGHTNDVTCVALSRRNFIVSGSADQTLKVWEKAQGTTESASYTCMAHDKDISVVKLSPDHKAIYSGSEDKKIKIWSRRLEHKGTLEGHRRGVWDLCFHPSEKILASSSGDMTIKLWELKTGTCIRTLEGHTNSVLKVCFITGGVASSSSDGLIKIWNYKSGACVETLEGHTNKVWGLCTRKVGGKDTLASGAAEVKLWKDVKEEVEEQELTQKREVVKQEQNLANYLKAGNLHEAAIVAFGLGRHEKLYGILTEMSPKELTVFVDQVVQEGLDKLLVNIRDWNAFKKFSNLAQKLLSELFERVSWENLSGYTEELQAIMTYSQKHYSRFEKLYKEAFYMEHVLNDMEVLPQKRNNTHTLKVTKKPKV